MKKFLLIAVAAVGLLATACTKDETAPVQVDETSVVTFTVEAPTMATRAHGDGTAATELNWAVYDANDALLFGGTDEYKTTMSGLKASVEIPFTNGMSYKVLFWAEAPVSPYTVNWTNKTVGYASTTLASNSEAYDAFYCYYNVGEVNGPVNESVELKRPFAQLNIITNDAEDAAQSGIVVKDVKVVVEKGYSSFNLATGEGEDKGTVTFGPSAKQGDETLAVNYLFTGGDKSLVDVEFTYTDVNNKLAAEGEVMEFASVPVQRNYRTNIVGSLLTSDGEFNVEIDNEFEDENSIYTNESAQEAIDAAEDGDVVVLGAGVYKEILDITGAKDITIKAAEGAEVVVAGIDHQTNGTPSTVTFENIIVDNSIVVETRAEGGWFTGTAQNIAPCVGAWGGELFFYDCKFIVAGTSDRETGIMTWWTTDNKVKLAFNNCVFEGKENHASARAMQIYGNVDMEVNNCTFTTAKDYTLKYVAGEGNVAVFEGNTVSNSENFVELGSSVYPGENYTVMFYNNVLGEGVNTVVVANDENQTIYINGVQVYATASSIQAMLNEGEDVVLAADINIETAEQSNGYGATGVAQTNGGVFDGNGYTLSVPGANTTWASAFYTTGGTIKNLKIDAGFRGIFVGEGTKVYLDNVTIDGPTYTISCDSASNQGLEAVNSTFNGWTSYAATLGDVKFTDCNFGKGAGYAFCRPYAPTKFVGCDFEAGYKINPRAAISFENCTLNGVALTATNIDTLISGDMSKVTVNGAIVISVSTVDEMNAALANENVDYIYIEIEESRLLPSSAFNHYHGSTIDGQGKYIWGGNFNTINTKGGTIKNLGFWQAEKAINIVGQTSKVVLNNVKVVSNYNCNYAIHADEGNGSGLEATGCEFYSHIAYVAALGNAKFTNCTFGANKNGSTNLTAYAPTEFVGCEFKSGYPISAYAACTFENCTLDGVAVTAANVAELVTSGTTNATVK